MAAVAITGNQFPITREQTAVPTTWQEFTLPPGTRYVTVKTVGASYVAWSGSGAADGGAVSATARYPQAANAGERWDVRPNGPGGRPATSVFVAAQAATTTVNIAVEGG